MSRNLQRKNKKEVPGLPRVKAIDIWDYQAEKFLSGELSTMNNEHIKEAHENPVELPKAFEIICKEEGWTEQMETFKSKIPNTHEIRFILDKFFKDVAFGEDDKSAWKYLWIENLDKLETMREVQKFYSKMRSTPSSDFFQALFDLNCDGLGKSEIFCAFLLKGGRIMGGTEPFDLVIENDKVGKEVHELKVMGDNGSIRLGKSKLIRYPFYNQVNNVLQSMARLDSQIDDNIKLKLLPPELVFSWKNGLEEFQPAWSDGEVGEDKLRNFIMFLYYMNEYIRTQDSSTYVTAVITETFGEDSETFSAPVKDKTYYKNDKDALMEFGSLRYVKNPDLLMQDLQDTIDDYFGRHINYFTVFRPGYEANICQAEDFVFDQITQSATKPIERKLSTKFRSKYAENRAWERWKKNPSKSFDWYYQRELLK